MAEKKGKTGNVIKDQILGLVSANVVPLLKSGVKNIVKKAQDAIYHTQKKAIENLLMAVILLTGFIFIAVAAAFSINSYFLLDTHWGFLIVGAALIITAYIFRRHIEKTKYYKVE